MLIGKNGYDRTSVTSDESLTLGKKQNSLFFGSLRPAEQDEEGMQTMRTLGRNMAWLILYPLTKKEKTQKNQHFWYLFTFYSVILCKFAAMYLITD